MRPRPARHGRDRAALRRRLVCAISPSNALRGRRMTAMRQAAYIPGRGQHRRDRSQHLPRQARRRDRDEVARAIRRSRLRRQSPVGRESCSSSKPRAAQCQSCGQAGLRRPPRRLRELSPASRTWTSDTPKVPRRLMYFVRAKTRRDFRGGSIEIEIACGYSLSSKG